MFDTPGRYNLFIFTTKGVIASTVLSIVFCAGFYLMSRYQHAKLSAQVEDMRAESAKNIAALQTKLDVTQKALAQEQEINKTRLTFLSTLFNENFAALSSASPNLTQDVMYVERNWKVRRLPKYLDMNQSDIDWFSQFLDKEVSSSPAPKMPGN